MTPMRFAWDAAARAMRRGAIATVLACALAGCNGAVNPEHEQWIRAGNEALRQGDNQAAIEQADRFLAMYPRSQQSAEAYYIRGLARLRGGQPDSARSDFTTALPLTRRNDLAAMIHLQLGNLAYQGGDMPLAERHYRGVLSQIPAGTPPADEAGFLLACILQRRGQWSEADLFFDRVMHLFEGSDLADQAVQRVHAVCWSIQAGAFSDPDAAAALAGRLRRAGLPARVDPALRSGQAVHRVRVGSYKTRDEAAADLPKVRPFAPDAYPVPSR